MNGNRVILRSLVLTHYERFTGRQTDTPPSGQVAHSWARQKSWVSCGENSYICLIERNRFHCTDYLYLKIAAKSAAGAPPQVPLGGSLIRPVQARLLETFLFELSGHGAVWTVLTAPNKKNILTYLLTYFGRGLWRCPDPLVRREGNGKVGENEGRDRERKRGRFTSFTFANNAN